MSLREWILAAALAAGAVCVTVGVAMMHEPAAWIVGGLLGSVWSFLVAGEVR